MNFICPKCKSSLTPFNKSYICKNKHNYDISKEGYVNLLLANDKKKKDPGDNEIMVQARESFLIKGYFDKLVSIITEHLKEIYSQNNYTLLDAGCGTGYYLRKIIKEHQPKHSYGIDISKHSIKLASKKDSISQYAVASIFNLPFTDKAFNIILNIFAPKPYDEFKRVLADNGYLIEVVPGINHLLELRKILYEDENQRNSNTNQFENFKKHKELKVEYKITLDSSEDIINLMKMTPYWYKTKQESLLKLNELKALTITFDFNINIWKKL